MITSITGLLTKVSEEEVRIRIGGIEHQVMVPDLVRRILQPKVGEEVTLHTIEYIEGNPTKGRLVPRLVGFMSEAEIEFFELFCTVDGIGVKKALKAMVKPVRDIADLVQKQDAKLLATLPGVSGQIAERIIAKIRKKVTKFALMIDRAGPAPEHETAPSVIEEAFLALVSVGHSEIDAQKEIEKVTAGGTKFKTAEDVLQAVYMRK